MPESNIPSKSVDKAKVEAVRKKLREARTRVQALVQQLENLDNTAAKLEQIAK